MSLPRNSVNPYVYDDPYEEPVSIDYASCLERESYLFCCTELIGTLCSQSGPQFSTYLLTSGITMAMSLLAKCTIGGPKDVPLDSIVIEKNNDDVPTVFLVVEKDKQQPITSLGRSGEESYSTFSIFGTTGYTRVMADTTPSSSNQLRQRTAAQPRPFEERVESTVSASAQFRQR